MWIWFYLFIYFWVEWWWRGKESRDLFECVWNQTNKYVCVYTHQSKFLALSSPILLVFLFIYFLLSLEFTIFLLGVLSFYYSHLRIWIAADYYFPWKEILSTVDSFREKWIPCVQVLDYHSSPGTVCTILSVAVMTHFKKIIMCPSHWRLNLFFKKN